MKRSIILIAIALSFMLSSSAADAQQVFTTPQKAVSAFVKAIRKYNLKTLEKIFGDGADRVFETGDRGADQHVRHEFIRYYDQRHEIVTAASGEKILVVGKNDWPFPIPLVKSGDGWIFDVPNGIEEIINRRVGRNELDAIQTCLAIADAEREYYRTDHNGDGILEYAQQFRSSVGQHNGLFWPAKKGQPQSPLGLFVANAADEGYTAASDSYHGYRYRLLTSQGPNAPGGEYDYMVREHQIGGFAILAYPAVYGDSGVMTFMTSHSGVMYQKDLGPNTTEEALKITTFDPGEGWTKVPDKDLVPVE